VKQLIKFWKAFYILCTILISIPAFSSTLSGSVRLKKRTLHIKISYPAGSREQARYCLNWSRKYLPAVERFVGRPFPNFKKIEIRILKGGASNKGTWIEIGPVKPGHPALLFHELNHYWFRYYLKAKEKDQGWLIEGLMSFLPLAMHHSGYIRLSPSEICSIYGSWIFRYWPTVPKKMSPPLIYAQGKKWPRYPLFYANTFKIQYIIYSELGKRKYHSFLKNLIRIWPVTSLNKVIKILNRLKKQNWHKVLRGWLFPGKFTSIKPGDFIDHDNDRLLTIQERYRKTSPKKADSDGDGYGDGWEVLNGFNPLNPRSRPAQNTIVIDGVLEPLNKKPIVQITDPKGDAKSSTDIKSLQAFRIGDSILLRCEFFRVEQRTTFHTIHLYDLNKTNYWLQTWNTRPDLYWISTFETGKFSKGRKYEPKPRLENGFANVFEMIFRPADFGLHGKFRLTYFAGGCDANGKKFWQSDSVKVFVPWSSR